LNFCSELWAGGETVERRALKDGDELRDRGLIDTVARPDGLRPVGFVDSCDVVRWHLRDRGGGRRSLCSGAAAHKERASRPQQSQITRRQLHCGSPIKVIMTNLRLGHNPSNVDFTLTT
jgi:hypothetical protein